MKAKKKVGRPKTKDKKVVYAFTIEASVKKVALANSNKKDIDESCRRHLYNLYNANS